MAKLVSIIGVKEVLANIKRKDAALAVKTQMGLRAAGLFLQRESQLRVPVNYGVLKASAFTRSMGAGFRTSVIVGYTASYAMYVHEAVNMSMKGQPRANTTASYEAALKEATRIGVRPPAKKPKGYAGHYWDPQGRAQAKFLEEPARTLRPAIRAIFKKYVDMV